MFASILKGPPVSGSIRERWFDATGTCSWFHFEDGEGNEWAGSFGCGSSRKTSVVQFSDERTAFVIAGGRGYIIDAKTGVLTHKTKCDYLISAISMPRRNLVVACDFCSLFAFDTSGLVWESERVAMDGIVFDSATSEVLTGKAWQIAGWYEFEFRPNLKSVRQTRFLTEDRLKFD